MQSDRFRPRLGRGLSARILLLTCVFVLIGEILIYLPSIARFRLVFLEERLAAAELASQTLEAAPDGRLEPALETRLLALAGVRAVTLWHDTAHVMLGRVEPVDVVIDTADRSPARLIPDALGALWAEPGRRLRVIGASSRESGTTVDAILAEGPLREAMFDYSWRILTLTVFLSLIVAVLLVASLYRLIVRPLRALTGRLERFRLRPEEPADESPTRVRSDEIGIVEQELGRMQAGLRQALAEKTRLAALGAAVSQLAHDLRNMLATAVLISDRLEASADPAVRKVAPRLVASLDRAIRLCTDTLAFARDRPSPPRLERFALRALVEDLKGGAIDGVAGATLDIDVPPRLKVVADRDQLYRVLFNLVRNSGEALGERGGRIAVVARAEPHRITIRVADNGPGIPEAIRASLFTSFGASAKPGGSGLGLAICRELVRAHGGDIRLLHTGPEGTTFEVELPLRPAVADAAPRRAAE